MGKEINCICWIHPRLNVFYLYDGRGENQIPLSEVVDDDNYDKKSFQMKATTTSAVATIAEFTKVTTKTTIEE